MQESTTVAVDSLGAAILELGCAMLPAVCNPTDSVCRVAVVNPSNKLVELRADTLIGATNSVIQTPNSIRTAATISRLSREDKLRKVLHELKIDNLYDSIAHEQPLIWLVTKYLDVFAKCDSDFCSTNLTFH